VTTGWHGDNDRVGVGMTSPIPGTARKTTMARKAPDRRGPRTQSPKAVKKSQQVTTKAVVKRPAPETAKAMPAKTVKRTAVPDKKPAAVPEKKVAVAAKKPGVIEAKPAKGVKIAAAPAGKKGVAVKTSAGPAGAKVVKPKKPRAKKAPPRMRVRWCVYDGMMKPVAMFDYNQRKEAEASLAQFLLKKPTYFLQPVKEPMPPEPEVPEAS
jgi:hypothetical protein